MSRPRKSTVDYFPHFSNSGKTIFTLESIFGNDGYAFWFKLLEILATSEGHYYRYGNTADWLFLVSKTRVSEETATQILKTLADLDAICPLLLAEKCIWCENLVLNLRPVYSKRKEETPCKPEFQEQKHEHSGISGDGNPQSKVKESKVKEKDLSSKPDDSVMEVFQHWQKVMGTEKAKASPERILKIKARLKDYTVAQLKEAIDGCRKSDHHMGKNDRKTKYNDIELICRDCKHVDSFLQEPVEDENSLITGKGWAN